MPTSLVTGGAGFLGSHICDYLLERGHRVICVDNLETGSLNNIKHIREDAFRFEMFDITDHFEIDESVDFVYHMASPASPIDYARLPLHTLKVGAYGTHNALGLAKKHRARFLISSTSEVYGDPLVHPQPETYWGNVNPIGPRGVYDEAKRYAEALTMAYMRQQGVDTCIARIFNTYGPRMRPNDGRAVPTFLSQALKGQPVTVFGDGSQTRSFCYVQDLIRGLVALNESDVHDPVNIGNPNEMTLLEMAELVVELTEARTEIVFEPLPVDDPQVRQPDITRARDLLGWEPEVSLREGLAHTVEHYTKVFAAPARSMTSAEVKNLEAISKAIDQHNAGCEWPAVAIEMNPFEADRLGWDSIRGLPIRTNPDLGTGAFRVVCAREEGLPGESERWRPWPIRRCRPRPSPPAELRGRRSVGRRPVQLEPDRGVAGLALDAPAARHRSTSISP